MMKPGKLYLIPVTLGDLESANRVLPAFNKEIIDKLELFIVEQTRTARRFLSALGHPSPIDQLTFFELNKHTNPAHIELYLQHLSNGHDMGLMSEAGTPCIADPGSQVVELAQNKGFHVIPLVGPNSLLLALMASGFNGQHFIFHGYLPIDKGLLVKKLKEMESQVLKKDQTQLFIETPYRNNALVDLIVNTCQPTLKLCIATDITLSTEQIKTKTLHDWKKEKPQLHKKPTVFLLYK